jgi:hypothetical protein
MWWCLSDAAGNASTTRRPARGAGDAKGWLLAGPIITQGIDHQAQQEIDHVNPAEIPLWRMPTYRACCQLEADRARGAVGNSVKLLFRPGHPVLHDVPAWGENRPAAFTGR